MDTGPILLYFAGDERVKSLFDSIRQGRVLGYTGEWNIAEFYYKTCEKLGKDTAELRCTSIRHSKINVIKPDDNLTRLAGQLKCVHKTGLSLADAYTLATARFTRTKLITTDSTLARFKVVQVQLLEVPGK